MFGLSMQHEDPVDREIFRWLRERLSGGWLKLDWRDLSVSEQASVELLRKSGLVDYRLEIEAGGKDGRGYWGTWIGHGGPIDHAINWHLNRAVPEWFKTSDEGKIFRIPSLSVFWIPTAARLTLSGLRVQESPLPDEQILLVVHTFQMPGKFQVEDDRTWNPENSAHAESHAKAEVNAAFQNNNQFNPTFNPQLTINVVSPSRETRPQESDRDTGGSQGAGERHRKTNPVKKPTNLEDLIRSTLAGMHKATGMPTEFIDEPFTSEAIARKAGLVERGQSGAWRNWMTEALKAIFGERGYRDYRERCRNRKRFIQAIDPDGIRFRNTASMRDDSLVEDDTDWKVTE